MLPLIIAALLISQDAPAFGIILSDDPEPPVVEVAKRPVPNLPPHAISDPFGWERSQCSPYIRKDESLQECQVRVRADLQAVMGAALPANLHPTLGLEHCTPGNAENGFKVECKPRQMVLPNRPNLDDRQCENQPSLQGDGRVIMQTVCRSTGAQPTPEGLSLTLPPRD